MDSKWKTHHLMAIRDFLTSHFLLSCMTFTLKRFSSVVVFQSMKVLFVQILQTTRFPTLEGLLSSSTEGIFTKRDIHNLQWYSYKGNFFEATNPSTECTSLENARWVFRLSSNFWNDAGYEKKFKRTIPKLQNVEIHTEQCPWKSSNFYEVFRDILGSFGCKNYKETCNLQSPSFTAMLKPCPRHRDVTYQRSLSHGFPWRRLLPPGKAVVYYQGGLAELPIMLRVEWTGSERKLIKWTRVKVDFAYLFEVVFYIFA